jgi:hypothetical protein
MPIISSKEVLLQKATVVQMVDLWYLPALRYIDEV